jgi:hypothetical protein
MSFAEVEFYEGDLALGPASDEAPEEALGDAMALDGFLLSEELEQLPAAMAELAPAFIQPADQANDATAELAGTTPAEVAGDTPAEMASDAPAEKAAVAPLAPPAQQLLAERLEKLSGRLRHENPEVLLSNLSRGDQLDALIAGFLAGYIAARNG